METRLSAIWSQVTALLEAGYSIIPVRDKQQGNRPAKSPYADWKKYQTTAITTGELWEQMERYNTTAIAILCGRISGNLEAIDVDVKWKPGIDARLFADVKDLYPNLWNALRVHKTPSGGYHIPYRIVDQPPPGNQKLAKREPTEADNTNSKSLAFIETRGEGGYILAPPSLGYSIFKPEPIPNITWSERNTLINLCQNYNELIKIEAQPKVNKRDSDYYDENPFEHFNKSDAGRNVLVEFGWQPNNENSVFAWFMRPGSKSGERHASYIKSKGLFYFWTTNTEFDSEKCYYPSTILAQLKFGGDYKLTYRELVKRGFGKIKTAHEQRLIKLGKQAPPNLSTKALEQFNNKLQKKSELHPHGVFWQLDEDGVRATIDREALYNVSGALGFYLHEGEIVRLTAPGFLYKVTEREWQDVVKQYIKEEEAELYQLVINTYEHFLQVAGSFTITRLPLLDAEKLLKDTPTEAFKFFKDVWIRITANSVEKRLYDELTGFVWADRVLDREFIMEATGNYIDFLNKAVEFDKLTSHVLKVIGYLAHEYKDETTPYIIVMTEQCPDPRQGGGSGKNLFCNLFKHITTVSGIPGEQISYDSKFFQSWKGQRLFVISDAPRDFKFLFLKELTSGEAIIKKLFKDERTVDVYSLPKVIVNTNYSYEIADGGLKRRIIPLEFTDFFTRNTGVRNYYRAHFSRDWQAADWAGYNYVMVTAIQAWLGSNLILEPPVLTSGGWRKQFEQTYGHYTADFIYDHFEQWKLDVFVSNADFKKQIADYMEERNVARMYQPSMPKITKAIEDYCTRMNVEFHSDAQKKIQGINLKGKSFNVSNKQEEEELPF